jgi:RNA recognition motif-containing protein
MPQQWNTPGPQMSMMPPQPHRSARAILLSNHEHGMYRKIFVKNISFDTNEDTLRRYFERFGHIEDGSFLLLVFSLSLAVENVAFACLYT